MGYKTRPVPRIADRRKCGFLFRFQNIQLDGIQASDEARHPYMVRNYSSVQIFASMNSTRRCCKSATLRVCHTTRGRPYVSPIIVSWFLDRSDLGPRGCQKRFFRSTLPSFQSSAFPMCQIKQSIPTDKHMAVITTANI